MRNFTKLLGIVALVASIVFSMAACNDDGNGGIAAGSGGEDDLPGFLGQTVSITFGVEQFAQNGTEPFTGDVNFTHAYFINLAILDEEPVALSDLGAGFSAEIKDGVFTLKLGTPPEMFLAPGVIGTAKIFIITGFTNNSYELAWLKSITPQGYDDIKFIYSTEDASFEGEVEGLDIKLDLQQGWNTFIETDSDSRWESAKPDGFTWFIWPWQEDVAIDGDG